MPLIEWKRITDELFFQEGPGVRNAQYTNEGIKLLNVSNLIDGKVDLSTSDRFISCEEAYGKYKHFLCDEGDFVIASSGIKVEYFNKKMGFITKEMLPLCMNTSTIRFKVKNEKRLDIKYFMYYLKSKNFKQQLSRYITGSAQLNFGPSHLNRMLFPICDIKKQKNIVNILDGCWKMIELRKQQLQKYDELIKARFVEMFVGKEFPILKWNQIFNTTTGKLDANAAVENGKYPFFTCSKEIYRIDDFSFDQETLLLAGNNAAGKYDVKYYKGKFNAYQRTYVLGLKEHWSYQFFKYQLEDKLDYLQQQSIGGLTKYLTLKILNELEFIVPPKELQNAFELFCNQIDKSKLAVQKSLEKTQQLFDSLMQEYFG